MEDKNVTLISDQVNETIPSLAGSTMTKAGRLAMELSHEKKRLKQELEELQKPIKEKYEKEGHPYYESARLWDDGVIHPAKTRAILIQALQAVNSKPIEETKFPVFRM